MADAVAGVCWASRYRRAPRGLRLRIAAVRSVLQRGAGSREADDLAFEINFLDAAVELEPGVGLDVRQVVRPPGAMLVGARAEGRRRAWLISANSNHREGTRLGAAEMTAQGLAPRPAFHHRADRRISEREARHGGVHLGSTRLGRCGFATPLDRRLRLSGSSEGGGVEHGLDRRDDGHRPMPAVAEQGSRSDPHRDGPRGTAL